MREMLILGRGGQGAQTAGVLLARAFFAEGHHVQTFSTYGGARRGTPVSTSIRVDDHPIRLRCNIEHAAAILCFDGSLLCERSLDCADSGTVIVVNSHQPAEKFDGLGKSVVIPFDGAGIARNHDMGKVVNSALLGAFVAVLEQPGIDTMCQVIKQSVPVKQEQNVAACLEANRRILSLLN